MFVSLREVEIDSQTPYIRLQYTNERATFGVPCHNPLSVALLQGLPPLDCYSRPGTRHELAALTYSSRASWIRPVCRLSPLPRTTTRPEAVAPGQVVLLWRELFGDTARIVTGSLVTTSISLRRSTRPYMTNYTRNSASRIRTTVSGLWLIVGTAPHFSTPAMRLCIRCFTTTDISESYSLMSYF